MESPSRLVCKGKQSGHDCASPRAAFEPHLALPLHLSNGFYMGVLCDRVVPSCSTSDNGARYFSGRSRCGILSFAFQPVANVPLKWRCLDGNDENTCGIAWRHGCACVERTSILRSAAGSRIPESRHPRGSWLPAFGWTPLPPQALGPWLRIVATGSQQALPGSNGFERKHSPTGSVTTRAATTAGLYVQRPSEQSSDGRGNAHEARL
jgi:hypothetical protein